MLTWRRLLHLFIYQKIIKYHKLCIKHVGLLYATSNNGSRNVCAQLDAWLTLFYSALSRSFWVKLLFHFIFVWGWMAFSFGLLSGKELLAAFAANAFELNVCNCVIGARMDYIFNYQNSEIGW